MKHTRKYSQNITCRKSANTPCILHSHFRGTQAARSLFFGVSCVSLLAGTADKAKADSPTDTWLNKSSLTLTTGWSTAAVPSTGTTGVIDENTTSGSSAFGWNFNNLGSFTTLGDLDVVAGSSTP